MPRRYGTGFLTSDAAAKVASNTLVHLDGSVGALRIWEKELRRNVLRYCITEQGLTPDYAGNWKPVHDVVFIGNSRTEWRNIPSNE